MRPRPTRRVALFSLEMAAEQLIQRILCSEARINSQDVRTGQIKDPDWASISRAMNDLAELDFYVDDTPAITILEVRAKARRLLRDKPNGLVIVDYLQLMQPQNKRYDNRQTEIADISRGLKILAKELERAGSGTVPALPCGRAACRASARSSRTCASRERSSRTRTWSCSSTGRRTRARKRTRIVRPRAYAEVIVAKHRNGPIGNVPLVFLDRYTKFMDAAERPL